MSGWLGRRHLPRSVAAELAAQGIPESAVEPIIGIAEFYWHLRDDQSALPTPSQTREDLEKLGSQIDELRERLRCLPQASRDAIAEAARQLRRQNVPEVLRPALDQFEEIVGYARQRTEPKSGAPTSRRAWLANQIADALEQAGVAPDTAPNGPLCQALDILFEKMGEKGRADKPRPDPVSIARTALRHREKNLAGKP